MNFRRGGRGMAGSVFGVAAALAALFFFPPLGEKDSTFKLHGGGIRFLGSPVRFQATVSPPESPDQAPQAALRLEDRVLQTLDPAEGRQSLEIEDEVLPAGLHRLILERGTERSQILIFRLPRAFAWLLSAALLAGFVAGGLRLIRPLRA